MLRDSSSPCQQEAVTEQTLSSLFLTAVRAVTERGDLKDRLREVKETLLPRKCPVHLKGISALRQCQKRL
jgi:hypothetical protein